MLKESVAEIWRLISGLCIAVLAAFMVLLQHYLRQDGPHWQEVTVFILSALLGVAGLALIVLALLKLLNKH